MNQKSDWILVFILVVLLYIVIQLIRYAETLTSYIEPFFSYRDSFMPVRLINLERYPDRKEFMSSQLEKCGIPFQVFKAYDGKSYEFTDEEKRKLFGIMLNDSYYVDRHSPSERDKIFADRKKTDPNYQKLINVMACALSHISAIMTCRNTSDRYMCILEDDGVLNLELRQLMNDTIDKLNMYDPDWHIVWLSGREIKTHEQVIFWNSKVNSIYRMDPPEYNGQGGGAYILSRKGIDHYLGVYDERGCSDGFDWFLLRKMDIKHGYGVYPAFVDIHTNALPSTIGNSPAY